MWEQETRWRSMIIVENWQSLKWKSLGRNGPETRPAVPVSAGNTRFWLVTCPNALFSLARTRVHTAAITFYQLQQNNRWIQILISLDYSVVSDVWVFSALQQENVIKDLVPVYRSSPWDWRCFKCRTLEYWGSTDYWGFNQAGKGRNWPLIYLLEL